MQLYGSHAHGASPSSTGFYHMFWILGILRELARRSRSGCVLCHDVYCCGLRAILGTQDSAVNKPEVVLCLLKSHGGKHSKPVRNACMTVPGKSKL